MEFRIREAREQAGYSQKELAQIIGVAQNTFHGYESGKHDPKSDLLIKIAKACNVTVDYLLGQGDYIDIKNSPSTAEAAPREKDVALMMYLRRGVYDMGFLPEGADLTDRQVEALLGVCAILHAIFDE